VQKVKLKPNEIIVSSEPFKLPYLNCVDFVSITSFGRIIKYDSLNDIYVVINDGIKEEEK